MMVVGRNRWRSNGSSAGTNILKYMVYVGQSHEDKRELRWIIVSIPASYPVIFYLNALNNATVNISFGYSLLVEL